MIFLYTGKNFFLFFFFFTGCSIKSARNSIYCVSTTFPLLFSTLKKMKTIYKATEKTISSHINKGDDYFMYTWNIVCHLG